MGIRDFLHRVDQRIQTKESRFASSRETERSWGNEDLDPTPPPQRTWKHWNYFMFFWAVSFNPNQWNTGSSLVSSGLLWRQATLSVAVGNAMCSAILVFASRGPAVYHVGYPAYVRASAGMFGSLFFVFLRGVVAIIYVGTQTFYAGKLVDVMLRCAFGHLWQNIPNHLPSNAGITTRGLAAFFIYWIVQLPFMLIHPQRAKWLYTFKSLIAPPVLIAIFAYVLGKNGGLTGASEITTHSTVSLGWAFMVGINSVCGSISPEIVSNADLARYARRPSDAAWSQAIGIFTSKTFVIFMGIACSSASKNIWGTAYWNMWDLLGAILDDKWTAGARTAIFLACLVQALAVMATNLASNCLPVGADLTGLFPRYFNIPRGQVLCVVLSLVTVPWKMQVSAQTFLTFLGSYVVFIAPVIAIMITDYVVIRRGNIHVPSLYNPRPGGPYYYYKGFNLRMYAAWVIGVAIVIHGLAGSFDKHANAASTDMYRLGFILAFTTGSVFYLLFCYIWPVDPYPAGREMSPKSYEYLGPTDGYFEDENAVIEGRSASEEGLEEKMPEMEKTAKVSTTEA
ncbi:putative allantoin permease [Coniochaeta ligniaria NRRL 30616]|uniref:Putative allantoin permease n=1 Tax=Coniochaeta ligniaria NRRL 30616 TaxID=1408157 RepID=A0A1J7J5K9_9PEZI|nr:putative allantoin permease [Coniochaeta ligniaria NRRL 30616]